MPLPSSDVPATFSGEPWPPWYRWRARRAWRRAEEHALRARLALAEAQLAKLVTLLPTHSLALIETRARVEALIEINRDNPRRWKQLCRFILENRTALAPVLQQARQAAAIAAGVPGAAAAEDLPAMAPFSVPIDDAAAAPPPGEEAAGA